MKLKEYLTESREDNKTANKLTTALFIIYLITIIWILLFKLGVRFSYMGNRSVNLIPFSDIFNPNGKIDFMEIILNVMIFLPLGIYAGVLFKRWSFGNKLIFFFLISLLIEGLQYILSVGAFDITDIITNILGGIIGSLIFLLMEKLFNNRYKSQKYINIISAIGTLLIISLLFMLKMNMLPVRYQ
jgi:glycopeptide antibiotics resistance protein